MDIVAYFQSLNLDIADLALGGLILLGGVLVTSLIGRFIFGKASTLNRVATGAMSILFMYILSIVIRGWEIRFDTFLNALPFVQVDGDMLTVFQFEGATYTEICFELLCVVILAFLVNVVDRLIPQCKNAILWVLTRCVIVIAGFAAYLLVFYLLGTYLPVEVITYAPVILLALLVLMMLTGALRFLVGVALTAVNPIIAVFYTFFFASIVGKLVTRAVLTAGVIAGLVYLLNLAGYASISIVSGVLVAFAPLLVLLVVIWYLCSRYL